MQLCQEASVAELNQYEEKGWVSELKLDGERSICNNGTLLGRKRSDKPQQILNKRFPHIKISNEDTMIDGEIVVLNEKGQADFELLRKKENWHRAIFVAFDVLKFEGETIAKKPLKERRKYLSLIKGEHFKIITEFHSDWKSVIANEEEGLIVKDPNSSYRFGRDSAWIKIKNWKYIDLVFNKYELSDNPDWKGIIAISDTGDRVTCAGGQSVPIKDAIDNGETITHRIKYLMRNQSGCLRMPTWT